MFSQNHSNQNQRQGTYRESVDQDTKSGHYLNIPQHGSDKPTGRRFEKKTMFQQSGMKTAFSLEERRAMWATDE